MLMMVVVMIFVLIQQLRERWTLWSERYRGRSNNSEENSWQIIISEACI